MHKPLPFGGVEWERHTSYKTTKRERKIVPGYSEQTQDAREENDPLDFFHNYVFDNKILRKITNVSHCFKD